MLQGLQPQLDEHTFSYLGSHYTTVWTDIYPVTYALVVNSCAASPPTPVLSPLLLLLCKADFKAASSAYAHSASGIGRTTRSSRKHFI